MKAIETTLVRWSTVALAIAALSLVGCELDQTNGDATDGSTGAADAGATDGGAAAGDAAGGADGGAAEIGCEQDGYCNPNCWDAAANLATDPDCTALCQPQTDQSCSAADSNCACNYYNFVCEAGEKCSMTPCNCDPDCNYPGEGLTQPCAPDGRCDSWCPKGADPDCAGSDKDGKYCGGGGNGGGGGGGNASCDETPGNCDAQPGTANDCASDLDCDGLDVACESDTWCDPKCPVGTDPDCQ